MISPGGLFSSEPVWPIFVWLFPLDLVFLASAFSKFCLFSSYLSSSCLAWGPPNVPNMIQVAQDYLSNLQQIRSAGWGIYSRHRI